jgi:Ni/Co efflux regulator RcnB
MSARAASLAGALALALFGPALADPGGRHGDGGGPPGHSEGGGGPPGHGEGGGPPGHSGERGGWEGPPGHEGREGPPGRADRGGPPGHWDRGGGSQGWDSQRYNGYWIGRRWYYGPPPDPAFGVPGFRPGFAPWRPGAYLPPGYRSYGVEDYWRYHLRRPPGGYYWVRVGDAFLLVSTSTGLIFDVVTGF